MLRTITFICLRNRSYKIDHLHHLCLHVQVQIGDVEHIEWRIASYEDLVITEGTGLLFEWEGVVPHNVIEMASSVSVARDCSFVGDQAQQLGQVSFGHLVY